MANVHAPVAPVLIQSRDNLFYGFYTNHFARLQIKHRDRRPSGVGAVKPIFSSSDAMELQAEPANKEFCNVRCGHIPLADLTQRNLHEPGFHSAGMGFGGPEEFG